MYGKYRNDVMHYTRMKRHNNREQCQLSILFLCFHLCPSSMRPRPNVCIACIQQNLLKYKISLANNIRYRTKRQAIEIIQHKITCTENYIHSQFFPPNWTKSKIVFHFELNAKKWKEKRYPDRYILVGATINM